MPTKLKFSLTSILFLFWVSLFSQQTTSVKVPPNKDTVLVKFTTTTQTTANTNTTYVTSVIPTGINPPPPPPPDTTISDEIPAGYNRVYYNSFDAGTKLDPNQCGRCTI